MWGPDPAWPLMVIHACSPGMYNSYKEKPTGGRALWLIVCDSILMVDELNRVAAFSEIY